jgi:hypothetical protein
MAVTVKGPPLHLATIACAGCSYILEYTPKDIRKFTPDYDSGDTDADAYRYILCPRSGCGKRTKIPIYRDEESI